MCSSGISSAVFLTGNWTARCNQEPRVVNCSVVLGSDTWLLVLEMWFTQSIRGAKSLALNQHNGNGSSWVLPVGETVCHREGITSAEALELIVLLFRIRNKDF